MIRSINISNAMRLLAWGLITLSFQACGGGDSGGDGPEPEPVPAPAAAQLSFPKNNEVCLESNPISETEGSISFTWSAASNADSYEVILTNLNTGVLLRFSSATTQKDITLIKGQPYSWHVVSKAMGTTQTAKSDSWKFYLAGNGITWYAPFPAEAVSPVPGATVTLGSQQEVTLEWAATDPDQDISHYDLYLDTVDGKTTKVAASQPANKFTTTPLSPGTTYYWSVITYDQQGNSSNSGVKSFKTTN